MGMGTGLAPLQPSDLETPLVVLGPQILRLLLLRNEGVPHCATPSLVSRHTVCFSPSPPFQPGR